MSQIGTNIKKLRKVKGLSQQAFADLFNLTRGNISSYEEFRAEPRIEVILHIAKYFSIPVAELLEKQLTVNEILNFEDHFIEESGSKSVKHLNQIPFLSRETQLKDIESIDFDNLPHIFLPIFSKQKLIAIENSNAIPTPSVFPFGSNAILFFEQVEVDVLHTLDKHYGFFMDNQQLFFGQYKVQDKKIKLILNEWKKAIYTEENSSFFWRLLGKFEAVL